jgi:hypothetical protein
MKNFFYTVTATFRDPAVAHEWIAWLREGHVAEVLAAGAQDAEVVELDVAPGFAERVVEVRYHFDSRDAFAAYERDHAPRLRAAGVSIFPPERGITYRRATGEVVQRWDRTR